MKNKVITGLLVLFSFSYCYSQGDYVFKVRRSGILEIELKLRTDFGLSSITLNRTAAEKSLADFSKKKIREPIQSNPFYTTMLNMSVNDWEKIELRLNSNNECDFNTPYYITLLGPDKTILKKLELRNNMNCTPVEIQLFMSDLQKLFYIGETEP